MRAVPVLVASLALLVAFGVGAGGASLPVGATFSAAQGADNAAGLVIAVPGGEVKTVCVRFSADAIDGRQLLDLAHGQRGGIDPVYARFGSRDTAVCSLCGTGCSSGDCFCQDAYWNYNVAHEGRWVRSGTGVNGRTLGHGDVDGWAFGGDGAAPPYLSFEQICGASAEPTASPTTAEPAASPSPSPSPAGQPAPTPSPSRAEPPPTTASEPTDGPTVAAGPVAPVDADPDESPTPTAAPEDQEPVATPPADGGAQGGGPGAGLAFLVLLSALVAATAWQRRRRRP